jgi:hypothetical protein
MFGMSHLSSYLYEKIFIKDSVNDMHVLCMECCDLKNM